MSDQEVVVELEEETPMMKVSRAMHGLFHWGGQSITVDTLVAKKDLVAEFVWERESRREKQKDLKQEHHKMKEDQQECQQQMIEIWEKENDQAR